MTEKYDVKQGVVLFMDGRYADALSHFYEGAALGDAECAFNYAYMLYNGIGSERDLPKAKTFFTFASGRIGEAAYNLAIMYLFGRGVRVDYKRAVAYMQDAALMDIIEAQLYLAVAYTLGDLFEPDIVLLSRIPYHTAIHRDQAFYLEGDVPDASPDEEMRIRAIRFDPHSAFLWFKRAAMHGSDYVEELSAESKYLYARCFLDGLGTDFNRDRGNELMLIAARCGSREAMTYLETDAPYMLEGLSNDDRINAILMREGLPGAREE